MPAGRPTKCTPELIEKAKHYLENYKDHDDVIPSVVGMAVALDIRKATLHEWARDEDNEFSYILAKCKEMQENCLVNGGLSSKMNAQIAKLVLGKHGYKERTETDLNANVSLEKLPVEDLLSLYESGTAD